MNQRRPVGILLLVIFFSFGTLVCSLVILGLLFPGGLLEPMWRLKPEAQTQFQMLGGWSIVLMGAVGTACGFAAAGLALGVEWGRRLTIGVLIVNVLGDVMNAVVRDDFRTLIGLPITVGIIAYLLSRRVKWWFA